MNSSNLNSTYISINSSNLPFETIGSHITKVGNYGIFAALTVIYFWFGGMKFTAYEAQGLVPLVGNSTILGWAYNILSIRDFSTSLGFLELLIGLLIAGRIVSPKLSVIGGILSCGLFITTLSFMATTPGVFEESLGFPAISVAPGQFLLKDIGLLAASVFVVGQSLIAISNRK